MRAAAFAFCWCALAPAAAQTFRALDDVELAADHPVQRARIADNVDALDIDARPLVDDEFDVDGLVVAIARGARRDVDEGIARGTGREGQLVDPVLDQLAAEQIALVDRQRGGQELLVEILDLGGDRHLAEVEHLALVHRDGDVEALFSNLREFLKFKMIKLIQIKVIYNIKID